MSVISLPTPLHAIPTPDLETELLTLAGHIAAAQCRFLQLLAEFDDRDGWAGTGIRSCAHWLSWRAGMDLRTATEHLRVAHALQQLPDVTARFAAGQLSYSKVRAITRVVGGDDATLTRIATAIAAGDPDLCHLTVADPETAEQVLLHLALSGTASHVETVVRAVRQRLTPPENTAARRSLTRQWDTDGSLILRGRLTPDAGATLIAAIEHLLPPRTPATHSDPPPPEDLDQLAREQEPGPAVDRTTARRADALLALITANAHTSTSTSTDRDSGPVMQGRDPESRPVVQDGDADSRPLVQGGDADSGPVVQRGQAQVIVHFDATTGAARLAGGPELPASTAERLACDARVQALLDDRNGNRLYLDRARRLATPSQIAALSARDGERCQFPGCTHTRYLHAHHIEHWWHGGPTDIDNLILVCSHHHKLIHDHRYAIHWSRGRWEFRRPDDTPVPTAPAPLTGRAEALIEANTRARLRIDHTTLTPNWYGDRLDPEPILDALLPRRTRTAA